MYEATNTQKGFVALITAVIISVSLLTLVIAVGFEGYFTRFGVMESELKEESIYKAEACVNTAILKLSQSASYGGGEFVPVGGDVCEIRPITGPSNALVIEATASSSKAFTNLKVTVDASSAPDISVTSWEERGSF